MDRNYFEPSVDNSRQGLQLSNGQRTKYALHNNNTETIAFKLIIAKYIII